MEKIDKGWGHELIIESNKLYCYKELHFDKKGHRSSMHFHKEKDETWRVLQGCVKIEFMNMMDASTSITYLDVGDVIRIRPMIPHQVTCLRDNTVISEVSTHDLDDDNYRVRPGDSQQYSS